jgi:hypothetical protein
MPPILSVRKRTLMIITGAYGFHVVKHWECLTCAHQEILDKIFLSFREQEQT